MSDAAIKPCRGCELAEREKVFDVSECVHDEGCVFFSPPPKTFDELVIDAVIADLQNNGRLAQALFGTQMRAEPYQPIIVRRDAPLDAVGIALDSPRGKAST